MNRAIKYRVYPTEYEAAMFIKTFGCCRKVYNLMLADKIKSYEATGKFIVVTPAKYKKTYPFLKEVDSLALANAQIHLQNAFSDCFSKSRKKRNGFPKFKSAKRNRRSYTTNNQHGTVEVLDGGIKIPKLGVIKAKIHRLPKDNWLIKSATISQERDGTFYISVNFEYEESVNKVELSDNAIGLDYSSKNLYVDHNGNVGTNHKFFRESSAKLAKMQRVLSRRVGSGKSEAKSRNYLKQLYKVNKLHRHIVNQRLDNLHKMSTEIANRVDIVCVEDIDMTEIAKLNFGSKSSSLGKPTYDNGYGIFLKLLEYKLNDRGKYFVKVDRTYPSSQICHSCGKVHPEMKDVTVKKLRCSCDKVIDRDKNAALNIRDEGLRILRETVI